jgi:hypothetical protein
VAPHLDCYDRQGELTTAELNALRALGFELLRRGDRDRSSAAWRSIRRLVTPLHAARAAMHWHPDSRRQRRFARDAAALGLTHCADQQQASWAWSAQDWADLIGTGANSLRERWPGQIGPISRPFLLVYAYLLGGFTAFDRVGCFHRPSLGLPLVDPTRCRSRTSGLLSCYRRTS